MKRGPIIYDDFFEVRYREECAHGNYKNCAECDAEGERAMAELGRPYFWRGALYGWGIGVVMATTFWIVHYG